MVWWEVEGLRALLVAGYGVVLSLVVVVGVLVNSVGLYLLLRPAMRTRPSNTYFVLLLGSDVVVLVLSVPVAITLNGCYLPSYSAALYIVHPSFTVYYVAQTFTLYTILWISLDRCQAVWRLRSSDVCQQRQLLKYRLAVTLLICVTVHLRHLVDVEVLCVGQDKTNSSVVHPRHGNITDVDIKNGSGVADDQGVIVGGQGTHWSAGNHTQDDGGAMMESVMGNETSEDANNCSTQLWVIMDVLHHMDRDDDVWMKVLFLIRGLVVLVAPILLVLVFNAGIVVGMVRRRLHCPAASLRTRAQAMSGIWITMAISVTFIVCTVPSVIHAKLYVGHVHECHGSYPEEVFRLVSNLLLTCEHLTHFLILALNRTFRDELIWFVCLARSLVTHGWQRREQVTDSVHTTVTSKIESNKLKEGIESNSAYQAVFTIPASGEGKNNKNDSKIEKEKLAAGQTEEQMTEIAAVRTGGSTSRDPALQAVAARGDHEGLHTGVGP